MTDIEKALKYLKAVWSKYPNLRLGQLLCNVCNYTSLYYISDGQLLEALGQYYKVDFKKLMEVSEEVKEEPTSKYTPNPDMKNIGAANKGRVYIHKGNEVKLVEKSFLDDYIKQGFSLGRKDK